MDETKKREWAWIGDAVLSLYVRVWLLQSTHLSAQQRGDYFIRATSNHFLSALGKPVEVEARIGRLYEEQGLEVANAYIVAEIVPLLIAQLKNKNLPMPNLPPVSA